MKQPPALRYGAALGIARVHAALGESQQALEWLRKSADERDPFVLWINSDPTLASIRAEPGFAELLDHIGLPRDLQVTRQPD